MSNRIKGWIAFMVVGFFGHYVLGITPGFWEIFLVVLACEAFDYFADRDV